MAIALVAFSAPAGAVWEANRKMRGAGAVTPILTAGEAEPVTASAEVRVDSAYQSRFGFLVPQAFALQLPPTGDVQVHIAYPDTIEGAYARISFSTFAGGLVEELDVIPLRIAEGEAHSRRRIMSRLLITRVFADLTRRYINKSLEGVNLYALPGTDAVVLNGTYWDPGAGAIAVRIYGVMPKDSEHGLLFYERRYTDRAGNADRLAEAVVRSVTFE